MTKKLFFTKIKYFLLSRCNVLGLEKNSVFTTKIFSVHEIHISDLREQIIDSCDLYYNYRSKRNIFQI